VATRTLGIYCPETQASVAETAWAPSEGGFVQEHSHHLMMREQGHTAWG